jgi:hypothetical protein
MSETSQFAILKRVERVWIIGAIHGEAARLAGIHDLIAERFVPPGDRLVYLGNYLGHGAEIIGVIDEIVAFRRHLLSLPGMFASDIAFLRGGQEEMWQKLLQLQFALNPREVLDWMLGRGVGATLAAYGGEPRKGLLATREGALALARWTAQLRDAVGRHPGHREFFSALRRAAYDESRRLLFVHAGIDPRRPLAKQGDAFWWGGKDFGDWPESFEGFARVIRGFDPNRGGFKECSAAISVDDGCGFGGSLTSICLNKQGEIIDRLSA